MVNLGVCCASLKDAKALMKMGLGQLLVGHVNFLLGALVHGAVLRHINLHAQARAMEYAISNVIALVAGLVAVIAGISAIVLSKNKKKRPLIWVLLMFSLAAGLLATAATIGLTVSVVKAIVYSGRSLLSHCKFPDAIGFSSVTNQCPFDPTRIYGTHHHPVGAPDPDVRGAAGVFVPLLRRLSEVPACALALSPQEESDQRPQGARSETRGSDITKGSDITASSAPGPGSDTGGGA